MNLLCLIMDRRFENLTSEDAKSIFASEFVAAFNEGRLAPMYYKGEIPIDLRLTATHSHHK